MNEERPLSAHDVLIVRSYCQVQPDEGDPADSISVTSLFTTAKFHPNLIQERIGYIRRALLQLPQAFQQPGGASIEGAIYDHHGNVWVAGEDWAEQELDALIQLGLAAGLVEIHQPEGDDFYPLLEVKVQ